jgi:hypothetical protein
MEQQGEAAQMQDFVAKIFTPCACKNLISDSKIFMKNLVQTEGLTLQDRACAKFAKEK